MRTSVLPSPLRSAALWALFCRSDFLTSCLCLGFAFFAGVIDSHNAWWALLCRSDFLNKLLVSYVLPFFAGVIDSHDAWWALPCRSGVLTRILCLCFVFRCWS